MFKFNFNLDELDDEAAIFNISESNYSVNNPVALESSSVAPISFSVSSISDLIPSIPPAISYSPLQIPIPGSHPDDQFQTLLRRDLFDARFQLCSEDSLVPPSRDNKLEPENANANVTLTFLDAPSDLIAGTYEGGLKTWECSLDLAGYLPTLELNEFTASQNDFHLLEIGCGTAIPSLSVLRRIFSNPPPCRSIAIHFQDYNFIVLKLITFYNVILTWYASPASETYRKTLNEDEEVAKDITQITVEPGELSLTSELIAAFHKTLNEYHMDIKFISGSWQDTNKWILENGITYNVILSSETIYRISSFPSLTALLRNAASQKSVKGEASYKAPLCLIAAKVVYFGVGGGVESFLEAVAGDGGHSDTVYETKTGVVRKIMKITWT